MNILYDSTTEQFVQHLTVAVKQALATYPQDWRAIQRATQLLLTDGVTQAPDGTWRVASQSQPGRTYQPNGTCTCQAAQQGNRHCTHRWTLALLHKALQPYDTERLDREAAKGTLVALVCGGAIGQTAPDRNGVTHPVSWRGRNGGQWEVTANR
jgi:hypothetical protein